LALGDRELNQILCLNALLSLSGDCRSDVNTGVAQCYDGASVTSGSIIGVQSRFREICWHAAEFFLLVQNLYVFVSGLVIHTSFTEIQSQINPDKTPAELKQLSVKRCLQQ
jgi:hypothetical protein